MKQMRSYRFALLFLGLLPACSFLTDEAKVRFVYQPGMNSSITVDMFIINVSDGRTTWDVYGSDFTTADGWGAPHTPYYNTRRSGTLSIAFALNGPQGELISEGALSLTLYPDRAWEVTFEPAAFRHGCFGCSGYRAFSLAEAYRDTVTDSLYVRWGGNSIKNPVIY